MNTTFLKQLQQKGWVRVEDTFYPPEQARELNLPAVKRRNKFVKTGWIDDERNIRNKANQVDGFIRLVKSELGLDVWPEFYFTTERNYRIDYAIPSHRVAIEVQGGIWAKGNSGHSSGKGIRRDMDKANLLAQNGWKLLQVEPWQIKDYSAVELIRKLV